MPELCFQSFEEMRDDIVTGNFTEKELENLQRMSIRGFCQLPINVYSPPVPVFPEYWVIEREYIRFADNEFQIRYTKGDLEVTFEYGLNENNIDSNKKYPGIFEWPYYVLTDGPKTLYVTEDVRDTYNILYAHYDINGFEFMITFEHSGSNKKRPSDPELLGINIEYLDLKT